ncbi:hypothetical protein ISS40_01655 [Candidatus Bathyarchaeota archaeon]|nr:hypothetical protein [Candidatus Bathyarchaeota archaeon]MBL7167355.1 hypothetical protein [Candidatus Bathyarchaeota archaeon]
MGTLFVVGRPLETETLLVTLEGLVAQGEEVHVIFVQGGVGNAADEKLVRRMSFASSISCLDADAEVVDGVKQVDFNGWVRLIEGCEKIVSWT